MRSVLADDTGRLGEAEIPPGKQKVDEYFGEVEVYYNDAQARVPVVAGSGIGFEDLGDFALKGIPEQWRVLRVAG